MMKKTVFALAILLVGLRWANGQSADSVMKVVDGVYVITGHYCNVTFLENESGVVVVDAGNLPSTGERITELIKKITPKPITKIILTHHHFDHVTGLSSFPEGVGILAHSNTKTNIENMEKQRQQDLTGTVRSLDSYARELQGLDTATPRYRQLDSTMTVYKNKKKELEAISYVYPTEFCDNKTRFTLGKDTVEVSYHGLAHTNCDLVVNFVNRGVIVLGDILFTRSYPYIDQIGNTRQWSATLKQFALLQNKVFIPGHGAIAKPADLLLLSSYLDSLYSAVKSAKSAKKKLADILKEVNIPGYETFDFQFFRTQNIEGVFLQM